MTALPMSSKGPNTPADIDWPHHCGPLVIVARFDDGDLPSCECNRAKYLALYGQPTTFTFVVLPNEATS